MPLSVLFLRFAGRLVLVTRPRHVHGRNTAGPLHPYYYGFQRVEHPITRTSGVAVPAPGRHLPGDLHRRVHRIPGLPARGQPRHLHDGRNRRFRRRIADRSVFRGAIAAMSNAEPMPALRVVQHVEDAAQTAAWRCIRQTRKNGHPSHEMGRSPATNPPPGDEANASRTPRPPAPIVGLTSSHATWRRWARCRRCPEIAPRMSPTWARRRTGAMSSMRVIQPAA